MVDEIALSQRYGFTDVQDYGKMRLDPDENRFWRLAPDLKVHATTTRNLEPILKDGLKPRTETFCRVWGEERIPMRIKEKGKTRKVLQCREKNIYMWDDLDEGIGQALATVGYLKSGDPAILVVNTKDLKLKIDPEVGRSKEDPISLMHEGIVPPDRVECFCTLTEEVRPDTGKLMCNTIHEKAECEFTSAEETYETLHDVSNWLCFCKPPA